MKRYIFNIKYENDNTNVWIEANSLEEARHIVKQEYPHANYYTFLRSN